MRIGLGLPVSGTWATPGTLRHVASRADELGFDSLWAFQRLLHPVDQDWGSAYHSVQDPLTSLAFAAAVTSRIRLGVAVLMAPYYAPIVLAKALTTVDVLSGGRLDVGIGLGWSAQEFAAVGVPMERRGARAEEFVACLKAIWTQPEVEFHGEFYDVPLSRVEPKPVQSPYPPLLMGGGAEAALKRIGRIADGWISSSRTDLTTIGESIDVVRVAATEAGRDPDVLRFVVRGVVRLTAQPTSGEARIPLQGDAGQIRADLDALAVQGVTEVFLDLNWDDSTVGAADPDAALANADAVLTQLAP
ncbi:MAG TPA: TIGR03619 family F420-dependent LLM class oxidoreductase [Candidatus Nanopelagicales bacterium]